MNMGTNDRVAAFNLGLKGSLMLYVLGSILFIVSAIVAAAVIVTQAMRYKHLAIVALRSLSMDGLPSRKTQIEPVNVKSVAQHFSLQPASLPWKPRAAV